VRKRRRKGRRKRKSEKDLKRCEEQREADMRG
jgi:hypothetical protein